MSGGAAEVLLQNLLQTRLQPPSERLTWLAPPVEGKELFTAPSAALGYKLLPTGLRSRLIPLLTV
jgi:hypothetical protein